jgi:hypothetical protein
MKEIQRLCDLGVLEWQPSSERAAPSFIKPKKNKTVCFLTNFWEVNNRLVKKPSLSPKISTVLQELEGLICATALDLNMGNYTISLDGLLLILKEYGPEIVYIKGIHNTIADAISQMEYVSPDTPAKMQQWAKTG